MTNKTVLDNGVRLVTEALPQAYSIAAGLWVEVGSRDEDAPQGGASHFLEHMAFKGTARRDALEIARLSDRLGGHTNAFTSKENTCFHVRMLTEHAALALDLILDIFLNPSYDPEEVERERQVILQEICCVEDTPDDLVHDICCEYFWPNHPMGRPVLGTNDTVSALGREALLAYRGQSYAPQRVVFSAVGKLEHQRIVDMVGPVLAALPPVPEPRRRQSPGVSPGLWPVKRDLEQVHVAISAEGPSATSRDRFAGALMNSILGGNMSSRLFQEVREKRGLAYSVYSYLSSYSDSGLIGAYLGVPPHRTVEAVKVAIAEMERLGSEPLPDEELENARDNLKAAILLSAENPDSRMSRLAKNEINFGRHVPLEEAIALVEAVTPKDVTDLAARCLTRDQLGITLLGPVKDNNLAAKVGL